MKATGREKSGVKNEYKEVKMITNYIMKKFISNKVI